MNPQELRIGNWIKQAHANIRVIAVGMKHCICTDFNGHASNCTYKNIQGIPISPDMLEKAGFDFSHSSGIYDNYRLSDGFYISHCKKTIKEGYGHEVGNYYHGDVSIPLNFLHQLQNFYYTNTNKELNIQL